MNWKWLTVAMSLLSRVLLIFGPWITLSGCARIPIVSLNSNNSNNNDVSQFTVETYCLTYGRWLFKPGSIIYHQYDVEIAKNCNFVRLFVTLRKFISFIFDRRIIIRISSEKAWSSLQVNKAIFSKILRLDFRKIIFLLASPSLSMVE